jgi:O-antigen/teichoic acid export membrane protein
MSDSILGNAAKSAGMRFVVLGTSAVLGIVITRLIIDNYGTTYYAQYGLLVGIASLLSFADLGLGAAIMNAVGAAADPARDDNVRRVLRTTFRVTTMAAVILCITSLVISLAGWWPAILGEGLTSPSGPIAAALSLMLIAIALPTGAGSRVLVGLRLNHINIALGGLQSPLVLLALLICITTGIAIGPYLALLPYSVMPIIGLLAMWIAGRRIKPAVWTALRDVPRRRSRPGGRVMHEALPMLVIMIALPFSMQTDRIVLSHVAGVDALAEYNLAAQMFNPVWAVVTAAGITLWPVFARARAEGKVVSPVPMAGLFGGLAGAAAFAMALLSPWLANAATGGRITLSASLVIAYVLFLIVQGLKYPFGMFMTDAAGLRFQAICVVAMLPVNLGLSIVLAGQFGAVGPILGSLIGVTLFQLLPGYVYTRHQLRRMTQEAALVLDESESVSA